MLSIKPIGDRILVKPKKEEEVTASGILLPDTVNKEKKAEGEIIALGNGEIVLKLGLRVGSKVLFKKWGGEEVKLGTGKDEEDYKILFVSNDEKSDVIAIIE